MLGIHKKTIAIFLTILVLFSIENTLVLAQGIPTTQSAAITMTMSPENPKPGDSVDLELSSYSVDLDAAKITWYVDTVATAEGVGQKGLTVQAKNDGSPSAIKVIVEDTDGNSTEVDQQITPAGVDLIIEPTGFVPPLYKGKALFINQGTFRAIAIPDVFANGEQTASQDLTFKWLENNNVLQSSSGRGQNSVTITGGVPMRDIQIEVQVLDSSGTIVADASKVVSLESPEILFYEDSPLYGVLFNKAISGSYYLGQKPEVDIAAEPYFFNVTSDDSSNLNYQWAMGGNAIDTSGKTNELVLTQATQNLAGTASITVNLNNIARIFQFTNAGFTVNFGQ
jgi:hypothetical protein